MGGSVNHAGHKRPKPSPRGHFWRPGEFYIPITVEMTTSPAWRTLGETARCILVDMLALYWKASASDTDPPKGGFPYTFAVCCVACSARTFSTAIAEIGDRGWFQATRSRGPVPHFQPGPWRAFEASHSLPSLPGSGQQGKAKPPKGQNGPLGHFRQSGQVYTPLSLELLHSEAWRNLQPLSRSVLLDMLHRFGEITRSDTLSSPKGFTYGPSDCRVDLSSRGFYAARAAIVDCGFFVTPHDLQRDGVTRFVPGPWRSYLAPAGAKFRNTARAKEAYLAKQVARRTAFLEKWASKNCGEGIGKNCGEGAVKNRQTIGKNCGEGGRFSASDHRQKLR